MNNNRFNKIILECSDASNSGSYSDKVSRRLMKAGNAKMLCIAKFAVDDKFVEQTKKEITNDDEIIVIDGCPINCAEKTITKLKHSSYKHINVADYGIGKGKTPVTEEKIIEISENIITN